MAWERRMDGGKFRVIGYRDEKNRTRSFVTPILKRPANEDRLEPEELERALAELACQFRRMVVDVDYDIKLGRTHKEIAERFAVASEVVARVSGGPTVVEFAVEWMWKTAHKKRYKMAGLLPRLDAINRFIQHLGDDARLPLTRIGAAHVIEFRDELYALGQSKSFINLVRGHLSSMFNAAMTPPYLYISANPIHTNWKHVESPSDRDAFELDEIERMLKVASQKKDVGEELTGVILFAMYSNARPGDSVRARWEDLYFKDSSDGRMRFRPSKTIDANIVVDLIMHPCLHDYLSKRWMEFGRPLSGYVFPSLAMRDRRSLAATFGAIVKKAQVRVRTKMNSRGHRLMAKVFYSLRHTTVTELAKRGVSVEVRMLIAGHRTRKNHTRYDHSVKGNADEAIVQLPSVLGGGKPRRKGRNAKAKNAKAKNAKAKNAKAKNAKAKNAKARTGNKKKRNKNARDE